MNIPFVQHRRPNSTASHQRGQVHKSTLGPCLPSSSSSSSITNILVIHLIIALLCSPLVRCSDATTISSVVARTNDTDVLSSKPSLTTTTLSPIIEPSSSSSSLIKDSTTPDGHSNVDNEDDESDQVGKTNGESNSHADDDDDTTSAPSNLTKSVNIDSSMEDDQSTTTMATHRKHRPRSESMNEDEDDADEEEEEEDDDDHDQEGDKTTTSGHTNGTDDEVQPLATKPRVVKLEHSRPSHPNSAATNEKVDHPKEESDEEEEEEDGDEEEDDYDDAEKLASNVCTAEYFLDKLIPDDYPTEISKDVKHINETIERLNRMYNFSNQIMQKLNPFFREMASRFTDFLYESQLDAQCMGSLFRIVKAMNERKPWALSFFDATGPLLTGGYRQGKFVSLGEFDQCLETISELPEEEVNNEPIRGQYCLLKPIIPMPPEYKQGDPVAKSKIEQVNRFLNDEYIETYLALYKFLKNTILRVGICLPDKCNPVDVENAMNKFLVRKTGLSVEVGPHCVKATDELKLETAQWASLFIFGLLLALVAICSLYEIIYRILLDSGRFFPSHPQTSLIATPYSFTSSQHQFPLKFMRQTSALSTPYTKRPLQIQVCTMFSLIRNTRVLFEIPAYRKLPIDTLRLLLIIFYFISNAYIYTIIFAPMVIKRFYVLGPMQLASEKKYFFLRMYYMLDCFLAISGISVALSFKHGSFSYIKYIVQNYLRYVVPILFSIGTIYVIPVLGSGPLWHLFEQTITHSCRTNLLPTVFFFNNINENIEEICNLPTAFVSLIFQMQLIAPLFLLAASYFRPKMGSVFLAAMFCLATITNLIPRFVYGYKLPYEYQGMKSFTEIKTSVMFYSFHPAVHVAPFIFGLGVGHLITSRPMKRYSCTMTVGVVSFIAFLLGFFYMENLDIIQPDLSTMEIVSMLTFGRIPMLTFFCWLIYASLSGCITIVKRFLSSVVWRPLAQLSYGFYIMSMIVGAYRLFSIRQTTTLSAQNMFRTIVSDAVVSFFLAYLIHIMVQQPMRNLRHLLLQWKQLFDVTYFNKSTPPTPTSSLPTTPSSTTQHPLTSSRGKSGNIVFDDTINGRFSPINIYDEVEAMKTTTAPADLVLGPQESIALRLNDCVGPVNGCLKTQQQQQDEINNNL